MEIRKNTEGDWAVGVPTDSWYGDRRRGYLFARRELTFPRAWEVTVFEPAGVGAMRPLSEDEVRQALQQPIGTEPLRKLAEGAKSAAIIVDDLTRPTPAFVVVPAILEELTAGGLGAADTRIIIGLGTHRPLTRAEQRRKLGRDVVDRVEVVNHNAFTRGITRFSRPDGGPDFGIHRVVGEADLKISVSGVHPHGGAGFGGGAKAILPSVADYPSIMFNHQTYEWQTYGTHYPEQITDACIRRDMEIVAEAAGLDFSVNLVSTPYKEIVGLFGGHFVLAHRAACVLADGLYRTPVPQQRLDVIVAGGYPFDTDIGQSHRGIWPEKHADTSVLVGGARDGWAYHGDGGKSYREHRRLQKQQPTPDVYRFMGTANASTSEGRYYYSPTIDASVFYQRPPQRVFHDRWDALLPALGEGRRAPTVGIFPYATIQLEGQPAG